MSVWVCNRGYGAAAEPSLSPAWEGRWREKLPEPRNQGCGLERVSDLPSHRPGVWGGPQEVEGWKGAAGLG